MMLGKGKIEIDEADSGTSYIMQEFEKAKAEHSMNKNFENDMTKVYKQLQTSGYFDENGNFNEKMAIRQGNLHELKKYSMRPGISDAVIEVADNGNRRLLLRDGRYGDVDRKSVQFEFADAADDRVLGIPYAMATAGDKIYIINGKVFTGWALYFSLSSIKSPEDYARNVDLVYNVPYLYSSILLKSQLGLGTGFDVNYGSEDVQIAEEELLRKYLFKKIRIRKGLLIKTGFHLGTYGNSYWALRKDAKGLTDKVTILQPERLKIFLDPMTTKIMFYIYLPPIIGGTTIASYPSDGRFNPNILSGVTLSYPTPIVFRPEDIIHFKVNDFTEYPFGFSEVKPCLDPATARLDINIIAPIIFKKYAKPMIHWRLNTEGFGPQQVLEKRQELQAALESMEPGSDPITTDRWEAKVISGQTEGKTDIFNLAADMDTQMFASTGAPETYFKPKGSTDRMISEQDKTFISRLKVWQEAIGEGIFEHLIIPKIDYEIRMKRETTYSVSGETNVVEDFLREKESYLADEPKYPEVVWNEVFKQDETQTIANTIALLNSGIISQGRAASRVGEKPISQQAQDDAIRQGVDEPLHMPELNSLDTNHMIQLLSQGQTLQAASLQSNNAKQFITDINKRGNPIPNTQKNPSANQEVPARGQGKDMEGTMENLRGGLEVKPNFDRANRNQSGVKDATKLGGSRFEEDKLKGKPVTDKDKRPVR